MAAPEPCTTPTSSQIGLACGLNTMHTRSVRPYRAECAWCFRPWPCPDSVWAERVLRLAREVRRGQ